MSKSNPEFIARLGAAIATALAAGKGQDLIVAREGRAIVIHDSSGRHDPVIVTAS